MGIPVITTEDHCLEELKSFVVLILCYQCTLMCFCCFNSMANPRSFCWSCFNWDFINTAVNQYWLIIIENLWCVLIALFPVTQTFHCQVLWPLSVLKAGPILTSPPLHFKGRFVEFMPDFLETEAMVNPWILVWSRREQQVMDMIELDFYKLSHFITRSQPEFAWKHMCSAKHCKEINGYIPEMLLFMWPLLLSVRTCWVRWSLWWVLVFPDPTLPGGRVLARWEGHSLTAAVTYTEGVAAGCSHYELSL